MRQLSGSGTTASWACGIGTAAAASVTRRAGSHTLVAAAPGSDCQLVTHGCFAAVCLLLLVVLLLLVLLLLLVGLSTTTTELAWRLNSACVRSEPRLAAHGLRVCWHCMSAASGAARVRLCKAAAEAVRGHGAVAWCGWCEQRLRG